MRLIFVGIQASGKGTQAKIIASKLKLAHISTGDLLRSASGKFQKSSETSGSFNSHELKIKEEVDSYMNSGKLVPDELMLRLLKHKLPRDNFILDGFPRNIEQARMLDKIIKIDNVVDIEISDETARKRLMGRWNCKKCGTSYNLVTEPKPKQKGICDKCNLPLYQREDDINISAINKRLEVYHQETSPILKHYKTIKINGEKSIDEVTREILEKLS